MPPPTGSTGTAGVREGIRQDGTNDVHGALGEGAPSSPGHSARRPGRSAVLVPPSPATRERRTVHTAPEQRPTAGCTGGPGYGRPVPAPAARPGPHPAPTPVPAPVPVPARTRGTRAAGTPQSAPTPRLGRSAGAERGAVRGVGAAEVTDNGVGGNAGVGGASAVGWGSRTDMGSSTRRGFLPVGQGLWRVRSLGAPPSGASTSPRGSLPGGVGIGGLSRRCSSGGRAAVALVDPALRHHLARMPGRLLFAHVPRVRRPRVGARLRELTRHKQLSPGMLSRRSRERKA